jgi:transcriptional regulator with PAS, ATPase and Fis domain
MGRPVPAIADGAIEALKAHPFPGNIRELKNIIKPSGDPVQRHQAMVRRLVFSSGDSP